MQSILSVSNTQTATLEANNSHKVTASKHTADQKVETEKESSRFSDVLDSVGEEEVVSESEREVDTDAPEDPYLEEESLDADPELDDMHEQTLENTESTNIEESGGDDLALDLTSDAQLENERLDKVEASVAGGESEQGGSGVVNLTEGKGVAVNNTETTQNAVNPILAQIETAKKIDTQITEVKAESVEEGADGALKTANKWFEETNKANKLSAEKALTADAAATQKESSETLVTPTNKLDNLSAPLKSESVNPIVGNASMSNELASGASLGATLADKVTTTTVNNAAFTQSSAAQSATPQETLLQQQQLQLQQPIQLHSKQLSAMMGERIMMMVNQGKHEVRIRLDPAELGSMQIKLQVHQEQLQVAIHTQAAQSRDLIEQNLPRLREQLAQQGINLGEANVEQQSQQQSQSQNAQEDKVATQSALHGVDPLLAEQSEWLNTQIPIPAQGIDFYA